jgi:hypothetical protein
MDQFTREHLKELAEVLVEPAVSVYMPTFRSGREVRQNAIRFKNLVKQAYVQLSERGMEDEDARHLLAEASSLEANDDWWQHQSDGLAMFLAPERFDCYRGGEKNGTGSEPKRRKPWKISSREGACSDFFTASYRVPLGFEELVTVGKRFHVRPMVRLLQGDGRFYVLAVSQNRVRLFEGTHFSVSELEPNGLPSDLRSALNIDEYTSSLQQHSTGGPDAAGSMLFHGHGGSDSDVKKTDEILPFFRRINTALSAYFDNDRVPLVFAGVEYLFPVFQQACDHKGLVETAVTGNPDDLAAKKIHEQAWAVVEPIFQKSRESAWNHFQALAGSESATDDIGEIIQAAIAGQIDTLLFADGVEHWGVVDDQSGAVASASPGSEDAEELINYAAVHTLINGGAVYAMPPNQFANDKTAGAVLRYPRVPGPLD